MFVFLINEMDKKLLRQYYLSKRKSLSETEIEEYSSKIHDLFFRFFGLHSLKVIHVFLPIRHQQEIDTWLIINTLRRKFSSKIIISKSDTDGEMRHFVLEKETKLIENQWKIPEPDENESEEFPIEAIELVLVPLLIFDKIGNRVGYGKGYYDRFLSKCLPETIKVGISLFEPIDEPIHSDTYDIRLDYCITPNKIWKF